MGLLDVINGMQNGPRGQPASSKSNDGMSIMTKAILALLAYKAVKHLGGDQPGAHPAGSVSAAPTQLPGNTANAGLPGGGLGDLLKGGLGGLLAGGAAGLAGSAPGTVAAHAGLRPPAAPAAARAAARAAEQGPGQRPRVQAVQQDPDRLYPAPGTGLPSSLPTARAAGPGPAGWPG